MTDEIPNFKKPERIGISISVDKESLDKLKDFIKKHNPDTPLSIPFDSWLQHFVSKIPSIEEAIEKQKKEKEKEGDKSEPKKL